MMHNGKGKKKRMSLTHQLLCIVIATVLPVNLLAIAVSSVILVQASRQARDSYQRELDTAMDRLLEDTEKMEEAFYEFLTEHMAELTLAEAGDPMAAYEMICLLHDDFSQVGRTGVFYLYDKGDSRLYLRHTQGAYPVLLMERMKENLHGQQSALQEGGNGGTAGADDSGGGRFLGGNAAQTWELLSLEGGYFLGRQYDYTNYRVGFLLDMESFLQSMEQSSALWKENRVYVKGAAGMYVWEDGRLLPSPQESWEAVFGEKPLSRNVVWMQDKLGISVGIGMVDRAFRGGLPAAYWVLFAVSVCSVFLALALWLMLKKRVVDALLVLWNGMKELEEEHLDYRIGQRREGQSAEFFYLYERFDRMAKELEASRQKDIRMLEVQLDNLRLQVNPHMLLNSFNMIYSLAQSKNYACIQEYSLLLVEYFRYSLKDTGRLVPLQKEMEFVENYVNIQKIRFPGAFTSVYHVQEECEEAQIPPLIIENFVENAMKYALVSGETIEVLINVRKEAGKLLISVCDTGRGMKEEILEKLKGGEIYVDKMGRQHIGVWNCRRRLEVFYGENASMNIISSIGQGTQIWLELPFWTEEKCAD